MPRRRNRFCRTPRGFATPAGRVSGWRGPRLPAWLAGTPAMYRRCGQRHRPRRECGREANRAQPASATGGRDATACTVRREWRHRGGTAGSPRRHAGLPRRGWRWHRESARPEPRIRPRTWGRPASRRAQGDVGEVDGAREGSPGFSKDAFQGGHAGDRPLSVGCQQRGRSCVGRSLRSVWQNASWRAIRVGESPVAVPERDGKARAAGRNRGRCGRKDVCLLDLGTAIQCRPHPGSRRPIGHRLRSTSRPRREDVPHGEQLQGESRQCRGLHGCSGEVCGTETRIRSEPGKRSW